MPSEYSWSTDEETYHGKFSSIDAAFEEAEEESYEDGVDRPRVWIGRCYRPPAEEYVQADLVLEHIAGQEEYSLECADGWPNASDEQTVELTKALQAVVRDWLDKHDLRGFFLVRDAKLYARVAGRIVEAKGR